MHAGLYGSFFVCMYASDFAWTLSYTVGMSLFTPTAHLKSLLPQHMDQLTPTSTRNNVILQTK